MRSYSTEFAEATKADKNQHFLKKNKNKNNFSFMQLFFYCSGSQKYLCFISVRSIDVWKTAPPSGQLPLSQNKTGF